jgi:hypothetical protein
MLRKILLSALVAVCATLLQAAQAYAYGGYHAGYTHVGPAGVQHVGVTGGYGGYGGGAYHAGATAVGPGGGVYHSGTTAGPYGGVHTGTTAVGPGGGVYHSGYNYSPSYSGTAYGNINVGGAYGGYVR